MMGRGRRCVPAADLAGARRAGGACSEGKRAGRRRVGRECVAGRGWDVLFMNGRPVGLFVSEGEQGGR